MFMDALRVDHLQKQELEWQRMVATQILCIQISLCFASKFLSKRLSDMKHQNHLLLKDNFDFHCAVKAEARWQYGGTAVKPVLGFYGHNTWDEFRNFSNCASTSSLFDKFYEMRD